MRNVRLATRIFVLLLVFAVVPTVLVMRFAAATSRENQRTAALLRLEEILEPRRDRIEAEMARAHADLDDLAKRVERERDAALRGLSAERDGRVAKIREVLSRRREAIESLLRAKRAAEADSRAREKAWLEHEARRRRNADEEARSILRARAADLSKAIGRAVARRERDCALERRSVARVFAARRTQVLALAEAPLLADMLRAFGAIRSGLLSELALTAEEVARRRKDLRAHWVETADEALGPVVDGLDDIAVILQHAHVLGADTGLYGDLHGTIHPVIARLVERFDLGDVLLADATTGAVIYSFRKGLDDVTPLRDGPFAESPVGRVYARAAEAVPGTAALEDYAIYGPAGGMRAAAIAAPILDGEERLGVLVVRLKLPELSRLLTGAHPAAQVALVGADGLSRAARVDAGPRGDAAAGLVPDGKGGYVIRAAGPVDLGGVTWTLVTEIDLLSALLRDTPLGGVLPEGAALLGPGGTVLAGQLPVEDVGPMLGTTGAGSPSS